MYFSRFIYLVIFIVFTAQRCTTQDADANRIVIEKSANILLLVNMQTNADHLFGKDLQYILDDVRKMAENNTHPYGNRLAVVKYAKSTFVISLQFDDSTDAKKVQDALKSDNFPEAEKETDPSKSPKEAIEKALRDYAKYTGDRHILPTFSIYITSVNHSSPTIIPSMFVRNHVCNDLPSSVTIVYVWYRNFYTEYLCSNSDVKRVSSKQNARRLLDTLDDAMSSCVAGFVNRGCIKKPDGKCVHYSSFDARNTTDPRYCPSGETIPTACDQQACADVCRDAWENDDCVPNHGMCGPGYWKLRLKDDYKEKGKYCGVPPSGEKCIEVFCPSSTTTATTDQWNRQDLGSSTAAQTSTDTTASTSPAKTTPAPAATTPELYGGLTKEQLYIIGGVCGGLLLFIIILVVVCCYKKKQKKRKSRRHHMAASRSSMPSMSRSRSRSSSASQTLNSSMQSSAPSVTQGSVSEFQDNRKRRGKPFPMPLRQHRGNAPDPRGNVNRYGGGPMKPRTQGMPPRSPRKPMQPGRSPHRPTMPTRSPRPPMPSRSPRPPRRY